MAADELQPASAWQRALILAGLTALAITHLPLSQTLGELLAHTYFSSLTASDTANALQLLEGFCLCMVAPRVFGLSLGERAGWRRHGLAIGIVAIIPPLATWLALHFGLCGKPFHGLPISSWLVSSAGQELLFTGFIYGALASVWGKPRDDWRGAFAFPMLVTPALFAAWHWPNAAVFNLSYMAFQFAYAFAGGWLTLNLRRWTGSALPGIAVHVAVNFIAAKC